MLYIRAGTRTIKTMGDYKMTIKIVMLKHTKGKWEVKGRYITVYNKRICLVDPSWEKFSEELEANARLIASAPDMLEWLIMYFKANIKCFGCYDQDNLTKLIEQATGLTIDEVIKEYK